MELWPIRTKDGHFDEYMKWVATEWKSQEETMKKGGRILDYKVYVVADPRKDEPDIILAEEFKNIAEFDRPTADEYVFSKHLYGSVTKANKEQADRGSMRTVLDAVVMREITLKYDLNFGLWRPPSRGDGRCFNVISQFVTKRGGAAQRLNVAALMVLCYKTAPLA